MSQKPTDIDAIATWLKDERGIDVSGYRPEFIKRRIKQRYPATQSKTLHDYYLYMKTHADEIGHFIDTVTINVSEFFRNPITFDYIADYILPAICDRKKRSLDSSLRIWSCGCSSGEEAYSIAMMIRESPEVDPDKMDIHIFATDIDRGILQKAVAGIYDLSSVENVRYGLLRKYFLQQGDTYTIHPDIRKMVTFAYFDVLDSRAYVPAESVFGSFDIVFCRNVLIYFNRTYQDTIFDKLYRSLSRDGYLVLGRVEMPPLSFRDKFVKANRCCSVYQKRI